MLNIEISQIIIQIIAFLIMLWIMKKFGWKPLLDTLENRKNKIQAEFDTIQAQKLEAKQLNELYKEKLKEIDKEARNKIQEAIAEGRTISSEIQKDAKAQAKLILETAKSELEGEIAHAKSQLKADMVNIIMNVTKKILKENLLPADQLKLIAQFVEEA